jgi:indolepyruvate ferredoxin oxidoreductase beta subunit
MGTAQIARSTTVGSERARAITVAILAMGGEGGGVLADWIVDLAEHAGYLAQATSVPGVAQRTGSTIYYIELFPEAAARAAGKEPVLSLMPVPGELDVVLASELMEAGRAVQRGLVTPGRTTLIASTHRVYSMSEKIAMGDGRVDAEKLLRAGEAAAKRFIGCDFSRVAEESCSVISAALFGALASSGALPFRREQFEEAIRRGGVGVESSLAAFAAGHQDATVGQVSPAVRPAPQAKLKALVSRIRTDFPGASHEILLAGISRLADFQDEAYAAEYLDRLAPIRDLENARRTEDSELLREAGRYLALWMSYEDAIRVADLKIRRQRFERIVGESRAGATQIVTIHEFLHPRLQEIADILPAPMGRALLGNGLLAQGIGRITERGRLVETTSLSGFLLLYTLAALRPWRRKSLRFERERRKIGEWLMQVAGLAASDYGLALEAAQCPRLIKGYGDTHAHGSRNFDAIMGAIPGLRNAKDAAACLKKLREAALADETGERLAQALQEANP